MRFQQLLSLLILLHSLGSSPAQQCTSDSDCEEDQFCVYDGCGKCRGDSDCPTSKFSATSCIDGQCICFAPQATVLTEARGKVQISDLKVNEKVLTASGEFKKVFTFSTFAPPSLSAETGSPFLKITVESLATVEMTPRHMVFLKDQKHPVEASKVKLGDYLMVQKEQGAPPIPDKVVSVEPTFVNGGFAPVTEDGTIVVDGIAASCYSNPLYQESEYVTLFGVAVVHRHVFTHMLKSPLRLYCGYFSNSICQVKDFTVPFKMPGIVLLDSLHEFAVNWGIQDIGTLLVGAIAVGFYVLEWIVSKLSFAGTVCRTVVLHRTFICSKATHDKRDT